MAETQETQAPAPQNGQDGTRPAPKKNKPRGKAFQKGKNSHTDEPTRRGIDLIPRGSVSLLYKTVLEDDGELAAQLASEARGNGSHKKAFRVQAAITLMKAAKNPRLLVKTLEQMGDRLEGRPVQKVEQNRRRTVVFYDASKGVPELGIKASMPGLPDPSIIDHDPQGEAEAAPGSKVSPPPVRQDPAPTITPPPPAERATLPAAKPLPTVVQEIARRGTERQEDAP